MRNAILVSLIAAAPALADTVIKKDGTKLQGVIVGKTNGGICPVCGGTGKTDEWLPCRHCDGKGRIEGVLIMRVSGNTISIKESEIAKVIKSDPTPGEYRSPREAYKAKCSRLRPGDADGHYELAIWCISRGLWDEAEEHLRITVRTDPSYADGAEKHRKVIDHKRDARAKDEARKALKLAEAGEFEKAAQAIAAARKRHAKSPFMRSPEAQETLIKKEFPAVYELLGSNLSAIVSAGKEKARYACEVCRGKGWSVCPTCRGTGEGVCPKCEGKGWIWCPDCNGTGSRICPRCLGTGQIRQTDPLSWNPAGVCPRCQGKRTITCETCRGKGKLVCPLCRGKGKVPGGCKDCGGTGRKSCAACFGTGLKKVTTFRWGPVPGRVEQGPIVAEEATSRRIWQGNYKGCLVTLLPCEFLHNGVLRLHLNRLLGADYRYLLVCIDNREGARQIVFSPAEKTVRFVMEDARQVEMLDVAGQLAALQQDKVYRELVPQFGQMAILPGAMANAIVPLDPAVDLSKVGKVFWGKERPWLLKDYFLTRAQIEALAKASGE